MPEKSHHRTLLFCVCIALRLAVALFAKRLRGDRLRWAGVVGTCVGIGFVWSYLNARKVGFFGGPVWWHGLRPVHAWLWLLFGVRAFTRNGGAWAWLLVDAFLGLLGAWLR